MPHGDATQQNLPGLDLGALISYLDEHRPGLMSSAVRGEVIAGGRSNLTYQLIDGEKRWVLRRPPLGHVLATAHDMTREYRVMTALAPTAVPVPRTELLCEDSDVIGAPFYLMEHVDGLAMRTVEDAEWLSDDRAQALSHRLIDVLADLHLVDYTAVGLGDFGKPDGYLERQVRRWKKQLESSRSRELPGIDELADWLDGHLPVSKQATIVHGDYRVDNVLVNSDPLDINAVLDWEMATLGDPLADLGVMYIYWHGTGTGDDTDTGDAITGGLTRRHGFPAFDDLVERYARRTGADVLNLDFYIALGYFKLAVVLEGIHYRYTHGETVGEGFEKIGALVQPLVEQGLAARG
jgi:aminoglycoside phosphotransferase (APT) family kinase protein